MTSMKGSISHISNILLLWAKKRKCGILQPGSHMFSGALKISYDVTMEDSGRECLLLGKPNNNILGLNQSY